MSGARVLVVDDEPQMLRSLRLTLAGNGFQPLTAATGEEALGLLAHGLPDVILLDLMLPGIDGIEVCRRVRASSGVPIIVLSARDEEQMKVRALDAGADDYLTKPFGSDELLARIRVALRHTAGSRGEAVLSAGDVRIDVGRRVVSAAGREVALTPKEYDVLKYMATHADRVLTHTTILREVWGPEYTGEAQYLRNVVLGLRRKLEADPARPRHIVTEPGIGYRFLSEPVPP